MIKKRFITGLLILSAVLLVLSGCSKKEIYKAGTYQGEGQGHGGPIIVEVTVSKAEIETLKVLESNESDFSTPIIKKLADKAVKENTGDIDGISGATETSDGLLTAIQNALSLARIEG